MSLNNESLNVIVVCTTNELLASSINNTLTSSSDISNPFAYISFNCVWIEILSLFVISNNETFLILYDTLLFVTGSAESSIATILISMKLSSNPIAFGPEVSNLFKFTLTIFNIKSLKLSIVVLK